MKLEHWHTYLARLLRSPTQRLSFVCVNNWRYFVIIINNTPTSPQKHLASEPAEEDFYHLSKPEKGSISGLWALTSVFQTWICRSPYPSKKDNKLGVNQKLNSSSKFSITDLSHTLLNENPLSIHSHLKYQRVS